MSDDYNTRMVSTAMHTFAGLVLGIYSMRIVAGYGGSMIAFCGAAVLIVLNQVVKFVLNKRDFAWWMGNGIWPYIATWYATWVFVFNM